MVVTVGERLYEHGQQQVMHHSMTFLALREGRCVTILSQSLAELSGRDDVPLFNLIRHAFHDLDAMTDNLA